MFNLIKKENMRKNLFIILMLLGSICLHAQQLNVTGKVTDSQNEAIIGASVVISDIRMRKRTSNLHKILTPLCSKRTTKCWTK